MFPILLYFVSLLHNFFNIGYQENPKIRLMFRKKQHEM